MSDEAEQTAPKSRHASHASRSARHSRRKWIELGLLAGVGVLGAVGGAAIIAYSNEPVVDNRLPMSLAERTGSVFLPAPMNVAAPPMVERITLPEAENPRPIWGATGRDIDGHIWIGVTFGPEREGAHLMRFDPRTRSWHNSGAVSEELRRMHLARDGEQQRKIHSRIVNADDGWLYFASTDEDGEKDDGTVLPRWGGHLWRVKPGIDRWQHLMAMPEGLVATSGGGRYVYVLGYWGHVLYQYDTQSETSRRVVVGSVGGHVSRNFLSSVNGHAFVPRVARLASGGYQASLVEFDAELREIAATPLAYYLSEGAPDSNHGITGLATLPDGRLAFTTARGYLYLIEPAREAAARVKAIGWFHPAGEAYAPSLFAYGGNNLLAGVTQRGERYEWVVYELLTRGSVAQPLDLKGSRGVLLYGSQARDDEGGCYLVGWANEGIGKDRPLVLRVSPAKQPAAK